MFLTISDEDKSARPTGPHFSAFVTRPECVKRLVRRILGGA